MMLAGAMLTVALALVAAQGPHAATKRKAAKGTRAVPTAHAPAERRVQAAPLRVPPPPANRNEGAAAAEPDEAALPAPGTNTTNNTTKTAKTKVYTFGAMDVEGKLKTPQLLYFLNRIKLELEMSAPDHRSFMKELERTADDPNL